MRVRGALSGAFAIASILVLTSFGCGGAHVEHRPSSGFFDAPDQATVPEHTVESLKECVRQHAGELTTYSHETRFTVDLTAEGTVSKVRLGKSTLSSGAMESCMMRALVEMSIPPLAIPLRSSEPFSGGEWMRHSKEPLGIAQAAGGLAALGPIMIVAAGVTIAVYVAVVTVDETAEAIKRWRRIENLCMPWLNQCLMDNKQPSWNIGDFGTEKDCKSCFYECKHRGGHWPDYKCPRPGYRPPGLSSN
ncbi:MAG: hypothetical protein IPM54_30715 [Polyangiaceae bacterium]|nr:hypothetical protein [Polyangiaceae bacterium]